LADKIIVIIENWMFKNLMPQRPETNPEVDDLPKTIFMEHSLITTRTNSCLQVNNSATSGVNRSGRAGFGAFLNPNPKTRAGF